MLEGGPSKLRMEFWCGYCTQDKNKCDDCTKPTQEGGLIHPPSNYKPED